jgi:hypothetical protein
MLNWISQNILRPLFEPLAWHPMGSPKPLPPCTITEKMIQEGGGMSREFRLAAIILGGASVLCLSTVVWSLVNQRRTEVDCVARNLNQVSRMAFSEEVDPGFASAQSPKIKIVE